MPPRTALPVRSGGRAAQARPQSPVVTFGPPLAACGAVGEPMRLAPAVALHEHLRPSTFLPVITRLRSLAPLSLATIIALSNSETAPSICRMSFDVGVSSRNECGLSAATNLMPRACSFAKPTSCTMRSRAKLLAVSTMMVRAPLLAMYGEHGCKPWPCLDVVSAANRCVVELAHERVTSLLGECCDGLPLALITVLVGADVRCAGCADVGHRLGLRSPSVPLSFHLLPPLLC